jgi:hypothetical protein
MSFADDHAVTSDGRIFHHTQNAVGQRFNELRDRIRQTVLALSDDDCLAADPETRAQEIAEEFAVTRLRVDVAGHEFKEEGRVQIDCTNWPGIEYTTTEWDHVIRPGHRFLLTVHGEGDLSLLRSRLKRGGPGRKVDVDPARISRVYEWPLVRQATELQADVDEFLADLKAGAAEISEEIERGNMELTPLASKLLAERQEEIRQSRAYLGDLRLTVTRDPAADTIIPALPSRRPGPGRSTRTRASARARTEPEQMESPVLHRPTLDEFYDHVVTVLGTVALGFERSPRRFAAAEEEALRDFILVTLNSHYEGAASGETFNGAGRTDILVRHGQDNAFIGECKFWGGEAKLAETFDQLLGYTTWQDNRLALIFFVRNKKMQPVIDTTRGWVSARPEFGGWQTGASDGQLRCSLRWDDPARKEGRLTIFLAHLPRA